MSNSKIPHILAFVGIVIYSLMDANFAIVSMWVIFGWLGNHLTLKLSLGKEASLLFTSTYSLYTIYLIVTNYVLVRDPNFDFFYAIDSIKFWRNSEYVSSVTDLIDKYQSNISKYGGTYEYRLFNLLCLVIAYLSSFFGENSVLIQKFQCVFFGALSMPLIYGIILHYTKSIKYSFNATLIFAIFSFVSTFSIVFSRDIHVYFLYTLATYLVIYGIGRPRTLVYLLLLVPITFFIRFEHGIFIAVFAWAFMYLSPKRYLKYYMPFLVSIPILIVIGSRFLFFALDTYDSYSQSRMDAAGETDSLAVMFSNFPIGIKQLLLAFISQTAPLPFWRNLGFGEIDSKSVAAQTHHILRFMEGISGTVWIGVWGIIFYGAFKKYAYLITKEMRVLFLISLMLILATTADIHVRRVFAVYPIIFAVASIFYFSFSKEQRTAAISRSVLFIIILYTVYFLIKI
ncbi:hypothetical protein [Sphingobacterium thalpophilum]|uniref:hypothetical protein n=1 Tax=Sphingobacterium thalpophilum TaxID=259 RepID=UPI0031D10F0F